MLPRTLVMSALAAAACLGRPVAISIERPAAVGMPVWLKIPVSNPVETYYPFWLALPASFGCKQVEVRRNGQLLPESADLAAQRASTGIIVVRGNPCGSVLHDLDPLRGTHAARLPLHLRYRFSEPGVYEVRYTAKTEGWSSPGEAPSAWTAWTPVEIEPGSPELRASWLAEMGARAPTDAAEVLTDFLPSILSTPDAESMRLLSPYLYHPNQLVRRYAGAALTYWPPGEAEAAVKEWLRARGPSDAMINFLARGRFNALPDFDSILQIVLPYLRSDSPVLVQGAVAAVRHLTGSASKARPDIRRRAEEELVSSRDHIRAVCDSATSAQVDSLLELLPRLR
jgi:hypothetical protein